MAESLNPITSLANNSVDTLIALANAIVNVIATTVVTANGHANGALTTGNSYVSGIFGAAVLTTGMLRGGTVNAAANLMIQGNTWINTGSLSIGNTTANAVVNSINITIPTVNTTNATVGFFLQSNLTFSNTSLAEINLTTTGASAQQFDSFLLSAYRSVEYTLQIKNNAANGYQVSKLMVIHDGGVSPVFTEYGVMTTNGSLGTFTVAANATAVAVTVTPTSVNTTIRALRTSLNV